MTSTTSSDDFQLQNEFSDLSTDLEDYGFRDVDTEENLLLRCCAAILAYDPTPDVLVKISGEEVRRRFAEVRNGVKGALDFVNMNLSVQSITNLPFQTLLVPLSVFFAAGDGVEIQVSEQQRRQLLRWFWRTCFARRYSGGVIRNLRDDIAQVRVLKAGQESKLGQFSCATSAEFFHDNNFTISAVNTKTFVLLLAQEKPLSFVSGTPVDLAQKLRAYNKTEFHHLTPKAYLKTLPEKNYSPNCLANYAFLTRAENRTLGGKAPSLYRSKMATNQSQILTSAICPDSLFSDDFDRFIEDRSRQLEGKARSVIN